MVEVLPPAFFGLLRLFVESSVQGGVEVEEEGVGVLLDGGLSFSWLYFAVEVGVSGVSLLRLDDRSDLS